MGENSFFSRGVRAHLAMGNKQSLDNAEVQEIAQSAEISPKRVKELHRKWLEFAGKGKKTLNKAEFTAWTLQQNIVPDAVTGERIFEQLDADKNGELEFQEFVRVEMLNKQNKTLEGYVETIFSCTIRMAMVSSAAR